MAYQALWGGAKFCKDLVEEMQGAEARIGQLQQQLDNLEKGEKGYAIGTR